MSRRLSALNEGAKSMIIKKEKCPICGGAVNDDGKCEKCGVSYLKICETEHEVEINSIAVFALIAAAVAFVFS